MSLKEMFVFTLSFLGIIGGAIFMLFSFVSIIMTEIIEGIPFITTDGVFEFALFTEGLLWTGVGCLIGCLGVYNVYRLAKKYDLG